MHRTTLLLFSLITRLSVVCLSFMSCAAARADAERPNIVVLLADDLGWADVGYHGSQIRTPQIDAMAREGVELDSFYVQPTCTPTRTAMMTGRYPYQFGAHVCVLRPFHTHGIPTDVRFLSEAMRDAGYTTAITGKWHLGLARRAYWPQSRGFDLCHGHLGGAIDYFTHDGYGSLDWYDNEHLPLEEPGYSTDLIGARAVKIIETHDFTAKPLFLYVPFNAPHVPIQAKPEDIQSYAEVFQDKQRRTYAAMVTSMDVQIGAIRQALAARGVDRETLVLFMSDNGGHRDGADNRPLRGDKGSLYEGGIRVPAAMVWPGHLEPGAQRKQVMHIVDLFPTFVTLAGGNLHQEKSLNGINLWQALRDNDPLPERDLIHNARQGDRAGALRRGPWKLVVTAADKAEARAKGGDPTPIPGTKTVGELFHLGDDPYEKKNRATDEPELFAQLVAQLHQYGQGEVSSAPYCAKQPADWQAPKDWSGAPE